MLSIASPQRSPPETGNQRLPTDNCFTDSLTSARIPPGRLSTCRRRTIQFSKTTECHGQGLQGPAPDLVRKPGFQSLETLRMLSLKPATGGHQTQHPVFASPSDERKHGSLARTSTRSKPNQRRRAFERRLCTTRNVVRLLGLIKAGEKTQETCPEPTPS